MTPDQIEAERKPFEAAMIRLGRVGMVEWQDGHPVWTSDKADWQIWLARAELIHERQAEEKGGGRDDSQSKRPNRQDARGDRVVRSTGRGEAIAIKQGIQRP